ncbi:hypothetical protein SAY87_010696 [Trapa incisa]|uniref:BZIP domain-containing protein n=1 Tax=Trapa incisa TaxID=236973 RepID=A0AAN7JHT2_9MYRT|nr:hypothetical protein SAY87_010696 [Trapa incisa]
MAIILLLELNQQEANAYAVGIFSRENLDNNPFPHPLQNFDRVPSSLSHPNCSNSCVRSMEEVWQEIDLSSILDHSRPGRAGPMASAAFHAGGSAAVSLQDFLARPFHRENAIISGSSSRNNSVSRSSAGSFIPAFPGPPLATALSLASRLDSTNRIDPAPPQLLRAGGSLHNPFLFKDRLAPSPMEDGVDHSEQKRRRLMKNRESAARSRARKQAYTDELESEVIQLQKENAKLRMQNHETSPLCSKGVLQVQKLNGSFSCVPQCYQENGKLAITAVCVLCDSP